MATDPITSIQKLLNYLKSKTRLNETDMALISMLYKPMQLKRKEFLLKQGDVCRFEGFVAKGSFRIFYTDTKGLEHVLYFAFENWWAGDISSFYEQEPSGLSIQALQDSEILVINYEDKERLYKEIPALEKVFRIMTQKHLTVLQKRFLMTVSAPVETRYHELLERCPGIEQLVPQHQIASYLGILPESLSRMKHLLAKKQ